MIPDYPTKCYENIRVESVDSLENLDNSTQMRMVKEAYDKTKEELGWREPPKVEVNLGRGRTGAADNIPLFYLRRSNSILVANGLDLSIYVEKGQKDLSFLLANLRCANLDLSRLDTSGAENMWGMFTNFVCCYINFDDFDTSSATEMGEMFSYCVADYLDLTSFDTRHVKSMEFMFAGTLAEYIDLSSFDTSNLAVTENMFYQSVKDGYIVADDDTLVTLANYAYVDVRDQLE